MVGDIVMEDGKNDVEIETPIFDYEADLVVALSPSFLASLSLVQVFPLFLLAAEGGRRTRW
ncbi:hypothetical protein Taro_029445 [Colocasia esculenta]|uniref:Uncharacterized protein n=1 Tax=Colocasia esculenta TaxID=4460 RepID=A0A843VP32_COLES|nr:hypothetical protein [Colocasia esculenta]